MNNLDEYAILRELNRKLQVDNEEYYKHNQALLQRNMSLAGELSRLRANHRAKLETIENLQSLLCDARDEIGELRKHNGDLARVGLKQEKYNFSRIRNLLDIQGQHGNWDYNPYMQGMYNGLECALATLESRQPEYRSVEWLYTNSQKSKFVIPVEGL